MFEQDYVMRLIKEMVRAILKLLFNIDTDSPSAELLEDAKEQQTLDELLDMVDNGFINEAENKIYEITEEGKKTDLEMALLFYSYLNDKSDEFLEAHNYSRDEIKAGLKDITVRYGVAGFAEMFLQGEFTIITEYTDKSVPNIIPEYEFILSPIKHLCKEINSKQIKYNSQLAISEHQFDYLSVQMLRVILSELVRLGLDIVVFRDNHGYRFNDYVEIFWNKTSC